MSEQPAAPARQNVKKPDRASAAERKEAGRANATVGKHPAAPVSTEGDAAAAWRLQTPRLSIEPFTLGDVAFIVELLNDPGWLRHIGQRNVHTADDARAYLRNGPLAAQARHGFALWAVRRRDAADGAAPVGMCGLVRRDGLDDVDLGYAFLPAARGQGLAREAAAAVLRHGFEQLGLPRIVAITSVDNLASGRVLDAIGMRFERRLRVAGHDDDSLLYAAAAVR